MKCGQTDRILSRVSSSGLDENSNGSTAITAWTAGTGRQPSLRLTMNKAGDRGELMLRSTAEEGELTENLYSYRVRAVDVYYCDYAHARQTEYRESSIARHV